MEKTHKRQQMIYLILNNIVKIGFKDLKMEDFVKMLPTSRATVYRYFSSRENIISDVVAEYVNYLDSFDLPSKIQNQDDWIRNVEKQLKEALILNSHISSVFLSDLKIEFPEQYQLLRGKIEEHNSQLLKFYQAGQKAKVFNLSKPELWILQDRLMIPKIIDPNYLVAHNLTIKDAIMSYVLMKGHQILKPEYLSKFDVSFTDTVIDKMTREIEVQS